MAAGAANLRPVTGSTSKEKPPAGLHRWDEAESGPSPLRFIDSFRPGPVIHNRSQGERDNSFMRNIILRLFWAGAGRMSSHCTNTLTQGLKTERQGGIKKKKQKKTMRHLLHPKTRRCQKRDGWMRGCVECEVNAMNLKQTWLEARTRWGGNINL